MTGLGPRGHSPMIFTNDTVKSESPWGMVKWIHIPNENNHRSLISPLSPRRCDVTTGDLWRLENTRYWYCDVISVDCSCTHKLELSWYPMMTSNGNIFRVTGPLYREFIGHRWIRLTNASDAELWCFLWSLRVNKRLSKQSWGWWFETTSRSLWRHSNALVLVNNNREHRCFHHPVWRVRISSLSSSDFLHGATNLTCALIYRVDVNWR